MRRVPGFRIPRCHGRGGQEGEELAVGFDGGDHFVEQGWVVGEVARGGQDAVRGVIAVVVGEEGG